jgi:hypothetical protein
MRWKFVKSNNPPALGQHMSPIRTRLEFPILELDICHITLNISENKGRSVLFLRVYDNQPNSAKESHCEVPYHCTVLCTVYNIRYDFTMLSLLIYFPCYTWSIIRISKCNTNFVVHLNLNGVDWKNTVSGWIFRSFDAFSTVYCTVLMYCNHRYLIPRLRLKVVYLWRHVSSTAPPFILWWWNLEILFAPLNRSSPFIGELRCKAIQMEHALI